jgi:type 1 fimbria pilin
MNIFKAIITLIFLCFISLDASAECTKNWKIGVLQWTIKPGTVTVNGSDPIGKVLYTKSLTSVQNGMEFIKCTEGETYYFSMLTGTAVPGMADVYSSNIPGIGIRVTDLFGRAFGQPGTAFKTEPDVFTIIDFTPMKFELIKTAAVAQGGLLDSGMFMGMVAPGLTDGEFLKASMGSGTIKVNNRCTVTTPVIQRDMGNNVSSIDFKGVGTTLQEKELLIGLNCDQYAKVSIKFDATPVPDYPNIIALNSSTNSATGVGIQLVDKRDQSPVQLGTPLLITDSAEEGPMDLQFIARYFQTSQRVVGGAVSATATFTMTYQ